MSAAFFEMNKLLITRQNSQVLLSAISLLAFNLNTRHLKPVMVLFQPDLVQPQVIKAMDHGVTWPISLVRVTTVVCILSARFFRIDLADLGRFRNYLSAASATGYVQADLDSPYPRAPNGSVTTAWTRYGADGSVMDGMNGNGATGRRRLREGRV